MKFLLLLISLFTVALSKHERKKVKYCDQRRPVFLFNGMLGSTINANLNIPATEKLPEYCPRHVSDIPLWISSDLLNPLTRDCIPEYLTLNYNNKTQTMENMKGVNTYYPANTSVSGVAFLTPKDSLFSQLVRVYADIVDNLEMMGYIDTEDLQAAAFDWRFISQPDSWKKDLVNRIESTVKNSENKVVLIGHSMGGLIIHNFLESMPQKWIDTYISKVITISTPWAGSIKAVRALLSGDSLDLPEIILPSDFFLKAIRSFESSYGMIPSSLNFNKKVLKINGTKYNATATKKLIKKLSGSILPSFAEKLIEATEVDYKKKTKHWEHLCVFGSEKKTESQLVYSSNFTLLKIETNKEGDGTVQKESLKLCKEMGADILEIEGAGHVDILENRKLIKKIQKSICKTQDYKATPMNFVEKTVRVVGKFIGALLKFVNDFLDD
ncbi:lecithin:cholesterol acyltransferase domain containing protein [Entamoeba histolytica HM-1:IMSS-B]|uniref:Lecithin:cholesterol acyltransferase domain-containing protein n=5 Tax=Entamoeba histolytica TaxID=5759 RepID=C4M4L3_ENTH1|nr:lecithin:cholesterol acyltransferase domain-containing protein [Entamoeba histolytica HM-1:IMSS]EMH78101.1 lecithin:cholesterol acyltransferase domain containing protein [Entamoeba histolytica HM-1:IMSS-B]EMS13211.1 lecithin:cholesterol acyltransferase domain containing protein [Entamoeba histolytica HM-3:IMSS]ENY63956.1 lecithin:cholesterol acyltransferase domain containing protein [Entamoeba histolytica HM-1:IMSS-A]GAT96321.1 lecithin cholesterol acyltransferase domain-contain [Entamoeba h|eukprot:XP_654094.1 lecithin:cholesterol acyltransferase domain-containing protein [Entamoeba histolytica HM-1:IMSS]